MWNQPSWLHPAPGGARHSGRWNGLFHQTGKDWLVKLQDQTSHPVGRITVSVENSARAEILNAVQASQSCPLSENSPAALPQQQPPFHLQSFAQVQSSRLNCYLTIWEALFFLYQSWISDPLVVQWQSCWKSLMRNSLIFSDRVFETLKASPLLYMDVSTAMSARAAILTNKNKTTKQSTF